MPSVRMPIFMKRSGLDSMYDRLQGQKASAFVVLLILINESFFYLISCDTTFIVSLIGLGLSPLCLVFLLRKSYTFRAWVVVYFLCSVVAVIHAGIRYGQPLFNGIYNSHFIFIMPLYFVFVELMHTDRDKTIAMCILETVVWVGVCFSVLCILQSLLYGRGVAFMNIIAQERNDRLRFIQGTALVETALIAAWGLFLARNKAKWLAAVIICLAYGILVNQGRAFLTNQVVYLTIGFLMSSRRSKWITATIAGSYLLLALLFFWEQIVSNGALHDNFLSMFQDFFQGKGSAGMRLKELIYYADMAMKTPFFGIGSLGSSWDMTKYLLGTKTHWYYLEDIGVIGYVLQYGVLGLCVTVSLIVKCIGQVRRLGNSAECLPAMFMAKILLSILCLNYFVFKQTALYFTLMLAFAESITPGFTIAEDGVESGRMIEMRG